MIKRPDKKIVCCDCGKKRDAHWPIFLIQRAAGERRVEWCCRQCYREKDYAEFMNSSMGPV